MSEQWKLFDQVQRLTFSHLRGDATAEETETLDRLLGANRKARELYLEIVAEDMDLRSWACELPELPCVPQASTDGVIEVIGHDVQTLRTSERGRLSEAARSLGNMAARMIAWHLHPVRFVAVIATLTMLMWGAWLWILPTKPSGGQHATGHPVATAHGAPVLVARMVGIQQAVERPGSVAVFHGAHLQPGQTILLDSGLVKIRFQDGAETILEGPAEFTVVDSNRGHLAIGRLVAHITTPTAAGFQIDTPGLTIVDLGTEFGLDVDEHGDHDVSVFQGSVQVRLAQLVANQTKAPITVRSGQTLRVDGAESALVRSSGSSEKFVRRLSASGLTVEAERLTETFDHLFGAPYPGRNLDGQGGWNVVHDRLTVRNDYTDGRLDRKVAYGSGRAYRMINKHWQARLAASKQIVYAVTARTGGHYSRAGLGYFDGTRFHVGFVVGDGRNGFAAYVGNPQDDSISAVGISQDRYPKTETIAEYRFTLDLTTMVGTLQVDTGNGYFVPRGMERLDFSMLSETGEGGRNVRRWNSLYLRGVFDTDTWDNLRLTCLPAAEAAPQKPSITDTLEP